MLATKYNKIMEEFKMINFNAEKTMNDVCDWIRDFFEENGPDCNAVVGISGGKDSSVVAALCVKALGVDRVIGVLMPDNIQSDIKYSKMLVEHLGIKNITVNIHAAISGVTDAIRASELNGFFDGPRVSKHPFWLSTQATTNLPARIRMATLYAVSQSEHGRVANTCNLSEDWVGYATRYGDGAGDFSPLANLTVNEVKAIGYVLGLPTELIEKTPTDGLCGKTDEDNLGFTYNVLDHYIRTGECEDAEVKAKIDKLHKKNLFKLLPMPTFQYSPNNND